MSFARGLALLKDQHMPARLRQPAGNRAAPQSLSCNYRVKFHFAVFFHFPRRLGDEAAAQPCGDVVHFKAVAAEGVGEDSSTTRDSTSRRSATTSVMKKNCRPEWLKLSFMQFLRQRCVNRHSAVWTVFIRQFGSFHLRSLMESNAKVHRLG